MASYAVTSEKIACHHDYFSCLPFVKLTMPHSPEDLRRIAALTLAYYDQNAQDFWEGMRDHDVSQNIDSMLKIIEGLPHLNCSISDVTLGATS